MGLKPWYPPDYVCDAVIEADPDIGGLGVLSSFIAVSWITVLVAGVPALHEALETYRDPQKGYILRGRGNGKQVVRDHQANAMPRSDLDLRPFAIMAKKCEKLLGNLCDLQAITGIGITIAGWAQISTISYYHEALVVSYWWLTLNSFWTGRADYLNFDSKADKIRILVRRVTILCSCVLGLSFQGYIIVRELTWDDDGGPCNRFQDGSSSIPWMVGLSMFCIALLSVTFEKTRKLNEWYFDGIGSISRKLKEWYQTSYETSHEAASHSPGVTASRRNWKRLMAFANLAFASVCRGCWFIFVLWLAVWSYGDSYWPVTWCVYVLFNIWNTYIVISIWYFNQPNIKGDEGKMGFGQVLPLVLIASVMFSAVDIFRDHDFKYTREYKNFDARNRSIEL